MRVTILALGSRGDVQPHANLGAGLRRAGHQVRLATFEGFRTMAQAGGLEFHPIRGDAREMVLGSGGRGALSSGRNILRLWNGILRSFGQLRQSLPSDLNQMPWADTDVLINQLPGALYGFDLAEKYPIRLYRAATMPLARTRVFPMLAFPKALSGLPGYNALTYRMAEQIVWSGFGPSVDRWRTQSLKLRRWGWAGHYRKMEAARVPILVGISPHVVARPADWADHIHMTGYWYPPEGRPQDEDLIRFVESGPPPVFLGFGSMPVSDPARATQLLLDAIRLTGRRAVLHAGWAGLGRTELPAHVYPVGETDYSWLFPRTCAIVHHGGSGTTSFALRSGVPAVIVPFVFDQFYWGERVAALGVGPRAIPYRHLTAIGLAEAIEVAAGDGAMRSRAEALAQSLRADAGVDGTIKILEAGTA
ncbi:MAG: glycosyltransferase [Anaerolineales bacterium]